MECAPENMRVICSQIDASRGDEVVSVRPVVLSHLNSMMSVVLALYAIQSSLDVDLSAVA